MKFGPDLSAEDSCFVWQNMFCFALWGGVGGGEEKVRLRKLQYGGIYREHQVLYVLAAVFSSLRSQA